MSGCDCGSGFGVVGRGCATWCSGPPTPDEFATLNALGEARTQAGQAEELREQIASTLWHAQPEYFVSPWEEISETTRQRYRTKADALLSGPLAPLVELRRQVEKLARQYKRLGEELHLVPAADAFHDAALDLRGALDSTGQPPT